MKIIANILFEKLHRYVFDYWYQSTNEDFGKYTPYKQANINNRLEPYNKRVAKFYNWLCPAFEGWKENLIKWFPNKKNILDINKL